MRKQVIKRKELMILGGTLLFFVILIGVTMYFFGGKTQKTEDTSTEPVLVEGKMAKKDSTSQKPEQESQRIGSEAFFLKPTADEVLAALKEADNQLKPPPENLPAMKVMWPGYFFSLTENKTSPGVLQLDVDESGFGVILVCSVNTSEYPEVKQLEQGQKLWVAGQVTAIDTEGTGSVHINVEFIRFDEGPVQAQK